MTQAAVRPERSPFRNVLTLSLGDLVSNNLLFDGGRRLKLSTSAESGLQPAIDRPRLVFRREDFPLHEDPGVAVVIDADATSHASLRVVSH